MKATLADIAGYGPGLCGLEVTGPVRGYDIAFTIVGNATLLRQRVLRFVDLTQPDIDGERSGIVISAARS